MWLFGKKEEKENIGKPSIDLLEVSNMQCPSCKEIIGITELSPLAIDNCPTCQAPIFIPYRVYDYWLYKPLGGGGMGSVYQAISALDASQEFAVKILPRNKKDDNYLIECLLKEATIGKSFGKHPHLTFIDDFGECEGEHFCAMSFVQGQRLDQIIEGHEGIAQKFVLLWALQILSAEQRMYDSGYLYRDLKPQNIIIDPKGNVILIDYGLCISVEEAASDTPSESVEGSPLYMPPERIVGAPEGMSGEIYSLGLVIFHALTKETYYSAKDAFDLAKKHVTSLRMKSVETRLPMTVHPDFVKVLDKMIARMPPDRYQTYKEVAIDLKKIYNRLQD